MKIVHLNSIKEASSFIKPTNLVLGYFDGVHIGHYQLIKFAKEDNNDLAVLTFSKSLKSNQESLTSLDDKIELFNELNVDILLILEANQELKETSYNEFINNFLKILNPKRIFCGLDFHFGKDKEGDIYRLKEAFPNLVTLNFVNDHNGNKISSSSIKKDLKEGNIKECNHHLGRKYSLKGSVIHGRGEGKKLGFPTANILLDFNYLLPKNGVYLSLIEIDNKKYHSLTNVGVAPTLKDDNKIMVETYIIDFNQDIYDKKVKLYFIDKIRDEYKFDSLNSLIAQMESDLNQASLYFASNY